MKIGVRQDEGEIAQSDKNFAFGTVGLVKGKDDCVYERINEKDANKNEIGR